MPTTTTASATPRMLKAVEQARAAKPLASALLLSLQAFDAAARLGSFRAAAHALHLTPSAISHRIRKLEREIGEPLFIRTNRTVRLTRAGEALAGVTRASFAELARAAGPRDADARQSRLRLAVVPSFAADWLIPRAGRFMAANPRVELTIELISRGVDFDTEPFDAAICPGDGHWPGLACLHLMEIGTTPVCTPAMASELGLEKAADLAQAALIQVTTYPLAWPQWFQEAASPPPKPRQVLWVDSFASAQRAAEQGVGVALGLEPLIAPALQSGALARPIPIHHPTGGFWLVHRPTDQGRPGFSAFRRWLLRTLAEDERR